MNLKKTGFEEYPNVQRGHEYAEDVVAGFIIASEYVIGACQRYLNDLEENDKWYFDPERAEHFLKRVQQFKHVKGKWDTPNIVYDPWQCFIFMCIMGFVSYETGERRFRTAHVEVPRGNAKSTMASQTVLYFNSLIPDRNGNEISCVATKKEQARIVLDSARMMALKAPKFLDQTGTRVLAHKIVQESTNSSTVALSSETNSNDGRADVLAVVDELHALNKKTFEVVDSGMSKRTDSLLLCITTAGYDVDGVGHSQSNYAKKVATGEQIDDSFFSFVCTIDEKDDPWDEDNWYKANPNLGNSVDITNFKAKALKAAAVPADAANFMIKHLNVWISEAHAYFDKKAFKKGAKPELRIEDFKGSACYTGIDLASKVDLSSIGYTFYDQGKYYIFDKSYIPEGTVKQAKSAMYDQAIGSGHLIQTPGNAINLQIIEEQLIKDNSFFKVHEYFYDPWNATQLAQNLISKRLEMVEFRMNTSNLSEPTKTFDALIREGKVFYNGSPLLEWCLGNVVAKEDAVGNVFPKKSHEKLKIDPIISIIMGIAGWTQRERKESVYATRGIRSV